MTDKERNRFTGRVARYAKVGTGVGGIAAKMVGSRAFGLEMDRGKNAAELARALGGLKGPIMKVAQLLSTIPGAVPAEYSQELAQLQCDAPPMGWAFVKRRMSAELGRNWPDKFEMFEKAPSAAASLGQVHRASLDGGKAVAAKLQYPDMQSAVEADIQQLNMIFSVHRRMDPVIDTSQIAQEIADRVREELDYEREARHLSMYATIFANEPLIRVPSVYPELSTNRLMVMSWLSGEKLLDFKEHPLEVRNLLASAMFKAWWHPFSHYGIIHGDPHLGNYTVFRQEGEPAGINLLDYGCIRIFPSSFTSGVVSLYHGLLHNDRDRLVSAYETWGFKDLTNEIIDVLNVWASFIYGPLLEDRVRTIADGTAPTSYGRKQAFEVQQALKKLGPVTIPREFVFMDRAAIGLGAVFLHLAAELNFYELFNEQIADYSIEAVEERQSKVMGAVGLAA